MRTYKQPDRNAPRFRRDSIKVLDEKFYDELRSDCPNLNHLENKDIKNIIHLFHDECIDVIANTRDGIELPSQLGFIVLGACKKRDDLPLNHIISGELGMAVLEKNWESNQWLCKVYYTNYPQKYRFRNHRFWGFEAGRNLKKAVSTAFRKDFKKYVIINNTTKLAEMYRKQNNQLAKKIRLEKKANNQGLNKEI